MPDEHSGWYVRSKGRTLGPSHGYSSSHFGTEANWRDFTRSPRTAWSGWEREACPSFSARPAEEANQAIRLAFRSHRPIRTPTAWWAIRHRALSSPLVQIPPSGSSHAMDDTKGRWPSANYGGWPPLARSTPIPRCGRTECQTGSPVIRCLSWGSGNWQPFRPALQAHRRLIMVDTAHQSPRFSNSRRRVSVVRSANRFTRRWSGARFRPLAG